VLARDFEATAPNQKWLADLTYVPTGEGWLYLALILDLFSRKIVGWAMSATMPQELTLEALSMALGWRDPPDGLMHHSDRGSQYAAADYRRVLAAWEFLIAVDERPALTRLHELTELERTPLPAPKPRVAVAR